MAHDDEFSSDSFESSDDEIIQFLDNPKVHNTEPVEYQEILQAAPNLNKATHHKLDLEALECYIYPINYSIREYQFNIVKECFYENVICAIPTGTGKTFISSCVMLNYYRWFPKSKIIFVAPTRPLVAQQIKAAVGMTGIEPDNVAILLDKSKKNRPEIWESKRVFFSTPQVIENDLKSGFCDPKSISLIVIDEAHRTRGNYAYNNIIKFISRFTHSFRILALTATPGSDIVSVQEIASNLLASRIEIRTESSPDIAKYMKNKEIDKRVVGTNQEIEDIIDLLSEAIEPALGIAVDKKIYDDVPPTKINAFKAMEASQRVIKNPKLPEGLKWYYYFILQVLSNVGQMLRRLKVYGIKTFYAYFDNKYKEFTAKYDLGKSTNKIAANFYYHDSIKRIIQLYKDKVQDVNFVGHPKLDILIEELTTFFKESDGNSRVIIFTEMRESALEIVRAIDSVGDSKLLKPHIFIGQSKEKEKFDAVEFREKNKPKGRGRKKQAVIDEENALKRQKEMAKLSAKEKEKLERESRRTGSSESAQLNGMNQKQQKNLISDFKHGIYNILVATSIGEEGLDIGEVDLIVCYDATSSPIKNIQRMGRTGRKQDGKVLLLLTDQENTKFQKSMSSYEIVQEQITNGNMIKYVKSDRIVPKKFKPVCLKKRIEINEEFTKEEDEEVIKIATQIMNGKKKSVKKRKQDDEVCIETLLARPKKLSKKKFFMPDGVETGFKTASTMVKKNGSSKTVSEERIIDLSSDDEGTVDNTQERLKVLPGSDIMKLLISSDEEEVPYRDTVRTKKVIDRKLDKKSEVDNKPITRRKLIPTESDITIEIDDQEAEPDSKTVETDDISKDSSTPKRSSLTMKIDNNPKNSDLTMEIYNLKLKSTPNRQKISSDGLKSTPNKQNKKNNDSKVLAPIKPFEISKVKEDSEAEGFSGLDDSPEKVIKDTNPISILSVGSQNDEDITIEKVVKTNIGSDITSMIMNKIGALGYKNNKIVSNTLKRRTLGARRRVREIKKLTDEEMAKILKKEQQERLERQKLEVKQQETKEEGEKKKQDEKKLEEKKKQEEFKRLKKRESLVKTEVDLKKINDQIFHIRSNNRSGYISEKHENETYEKYHNEAKNYEEFALTPVKNLKINGKINHGKSVNKLLKNMDLMKDEKNLRKLIIEQKKLNQRELNNETSNEDDETIIEDELYYT